MLPTQQAPALFGRSLRLLLLLVAFLPFSCGRIGYALLGRIDDGAGDGKTHAVDDAGPPLDDASATASGGGTVASGGSLSTGSGGTGDSGGSGGAPSGGDASSSGGTGGRTEVDPDAGSHAPDSGDAAVGGYPSCKGAKQWSLDFDSDPTAYDGDHDGVFDSIVRDGSPFPTTELVGGVWHSPGVTTLDSRPKVNFDARTLVDVRLRSLTVPAGPHGAIFWINLNEDQPAFSALFASVVLQPGGGQQLTLYGKTDNSTETPIATFPDLPEDFVDLHLDIDPAALTVGVWVNATFQNTYAIPVTGTPNNDSFVTLLSWEGSSEFDSVAVRMCLGF